MSRTHGAPVRWYGVASWQVTLGLALLALGFLMAAQLNSQVPRTSYTSQERAPLVQTALGLQAQQDQLKQNLLDLRTQMQAVEDRGPGSDAAVRAVNDDLAKARISAALIALHGTGLVIQLEDSVDQVPPGGNQTDRRVTAADVRTVVEELWLAGAEAVAVNGERVTGSSAILDIGGSVLVNSAYLAPPYQVAAIGSKDLYATMSTAPSFADFIQVRAGPSGIRISIAQPADVVVPAYAGALNLRFGRPADAAAPAASPSPSQAAP
jgi:uncharacterized protein YlxW (UPF0749 family)